MKKILLPILAVVAIVGCKKEPVVGPVVVPSAVEITIANGTATKAVTAPAQHGDFVCDADDLTAVFANAEGTILESQSFTNAKKENGKYRFEGIDVAVSKVAVIALRDNDLTDITTLAEVKAIWEEEDQTDAEAGELIAYGEDLTPSTSKDAEGNYILSASVSVLPNHARIEISSIACSDFGVYSALNLKRLAMMAEGDAYPGEKYDQELTGVLTPATPSSNPGKGLVWSWNILGQETPVLSTLVGLEVEREGVTVVAPERALTIGSYKVDGVEIENFKAGNVYRFAIDFPVEKLWGDSEVEVTADVIVTIGQWVVNETEIGFAN